MWYEKTPCSAPQGSPLTTHRIAAPIDYGFTRCSSRSRIVSRRHAAHLREPYLTLDFVAFSCCRDWRLGLPALAAALGVAASKKASGLRPL